ncbi:hypothetical protein SB861_40090 [Paraburkholderia sp. SIMBA_049]
MSWTIELKKNVSLHEGREATLPKESITPEIEAKLKLAVRAAPIMAGTAIQLIQRYAVVRPSEKMSPLHEEVQNTLTKYFLLDPNVGRYGSIVNRIVTVYKAMQKGLLGGYPIYAYAEPRKPATFRHAYVNVNKNANLALSDYFADPEERHWDWDKFIMMAKKHAGNPDLALADEIHLNYEWFKESTVDMEMLALTIVHEASHKWAFTTDVCYKSSTMSKTLSPESLADAVRQGFQPVIERQNEPKGPMYLMAAPGKKVVNYPTQFNVRQNEAWITNADSYAWAARRLWKRIEIFATYGRYG